MLLLTGVVDGLLIETFSMVVVEVELCKEVLLVSVAFFFSSSKEAKWSISCQKSDFHIC